MYRACPSDRGRTDRLPSRISSSPEASCFGPPSVTSINSLTSFEATVLPRAVDRAQSLKDPPRLFDPGGISLDPDFAVPGKNLDTHCVANLPEKLVTTAEDRQLFGMTLQADCHFRHA